MFPCPSVICIAVKDILLHEKGVVPLCKTWECSVLFVILVGIGKPQASCLPTEEVYTKYLCFYSIWQQHVFDFHGQSLNQ